jgi:hypothetical protein
VTIVVVQDALPLNDGCLKETKISRKRKRVKAAVNASFRTELLAC